MPSDPTQQGTPHGSSIAATEQYELSFFANRHELSLSQAILIVLNAGSSREKADAAAEAFKRRKSV